MTSAYPDDTPRWLGYTHQDILAMVTSGRGREAAQFAEGHWHAAWFSISYVEANLSAAIADIGSGWEGAGATATSDAVTPLGRWALAGAEQALATSHTLEAQAGHAEHTRREMPPDPYPGLIQNPGTATPPDMLASWVAEDAARDEAAARAQDLMEAYTYNSYDTLPGMLESPPPPTVGVTVAAASSGGSGGGGIGGFGGSGFSGGIGSGGVANAATLGAGGALPAAGAGPTGGAPVAGIGGPLGTGSAPGVVPVTTGGALPTGATPLGGLPAGGGAGGPLPTGTVPVGGLPAGGAARKPVGGASGPVPGAYGPGGPSAAGGGPGGASPSGGGGGFVPTRGTGPDRAGDGLGVPPGVTGRPSASPGGSEAGRPGGGRWPSPEILPRGPSERWPAPGTSALSGRGGVGGVPAEPVPPPGRTDRAPTERPFTGASAAAERSGRVPAGTVGPGMMPMGAGAGAGQGREHRRPPYLVDDGSAFAHGLPLPPPVINEDPEAHRA